MTEYGLLPSGPNAKTAPVIRADIIRRLRSTPEFENARVTPGSSMGNRIDAHVPSVAEVWEAWLASVQAFSRDGATDQSLDSTLSIVGKARLLATYSNVTLTLWTLGNSVVNVIAGNLIEQTSTGTRWETLDDAVIPGATLLIEGIPVTGVEWQSDNTVRYYVDAGTDLTGVQAGQLLIVSGASEINNGANTVSDVNNGSHWIEIDNPQISDNTHDETPVESVCTITNGVTNVQAQPLETGPITGLWQTLSTVLTPVAGWDGATNELAALQGRNRETDAEFRRRAALDSTISQGGTLQAIIRKLMFLPDVTYVSGEQNRTSQNPDANGNKAHSYRLTVVGGTTQEIVDAIGPATAVGIDTNGSESGIYTDEQGVPDIIYFDRVTELLPYLIVNITHDSSYPGNGDQLVTDALVLLRFEHGQDLINARLVSAAWGAVSGILTVDVLQGMSPGPTLPDNLPADPTEVFILDSSRITVNS